MQPLQKNVANVLKGMCIQSPTEPTLMDNEEEMHPPLPNNGKGSCSANPDIFKLVYITNIWFSIFYFENVSHNVFKLVTFIFIGKSQMLPIF